MQRDASNSPPAVSLTPTGDVEQDITQLVCLIENVCPDDADQAGTPGLNDVVEFARALRARWDAHVPDVEDAYLEFDPGPEVDDEGGMSEYRYPAWPEDFLE